MARSSDLNNRGHNMSVLHTLSKGDLVEFERGAYYHWAVYLGNGEVVHLAGVDDDGLNDIRPQHIFTISGVRFDKAKVCIDKFWEVAASDKAKRNNTRDSSWSPFDPDKIINNALSKLGHVEYSIIFHNCEHFAKWCRYGIAKSDQVDSLATAAAVGMTLAAGVGLIHAISKYWNTDEKEKEKTKRQEL